MEGLVFLRPRLLLFSSSVSPLLCLCNPNSFDLICLLRLLSCFVSGRNKLMSVRISATCIRARKYRALYFIHCILSTEMRITHCGLHARISLGRGCAPSAVYLGGYLSAEVKAKCSSE